MAFEIFRWTVLIVALAPLVYYSIATYCGWSYFRSLRKSPPPAPDFTLDLSKLIPGIYYIRFSSANSVVTKKVVRE